MFQIVAYMIFKLSGFIADLAYATSGGTMILPCVHIIKMMNQKTIKVSRSTTISHAIQIQSITC